MKTSGDTEIFFRLKSGLESADTVLIGAGAGLSASAGMVYDGEWFQTNFADFEQEYGFHDMYSGGFYPFETPEEFWAYWSRMICLNRYDQPARRAYLDLLELVKDKDYFVLTTNVDHQFQLAGFDKQRLFYTQGGGGGGGAITACFNVPIAGRYLTMRKAFAAWLRSRRA
jgi:NAD-dependent SIR2 family protein deacetylase